ncbi:MAG: MopE-related protein [Sandaracinaceae bacterium]
MRRLSICLLVLGLAACDAESRPRDSGTDGGVTPDTGVDAGACVDDDEDGYGEGCMLGPDCDDSSAAISPAAVEVCNGADDDCDGATDEEIGAPSCALTEGVCAGATARCGPEGFLECEATDYGADFEMDEAACDGLDNDCDGTTDEGCTCVDGETQPCGSDVGACMAGTQTCVDSAWGACAGEVAPMGEVCDGQDNDCDGAEDEPTDLTPPDCPLQLGVCAGSRRSCGGAAGWIACSGTASYGGDYEASETLCDGLDNDCDGVVDPGCDCTDGSTQPCGTDVGACTAGRQTCIAGAWGACAGEVAPSSETCDGTDQDCDGLTDEAVMAPACALTDGVCAGAMQTCGGAGGFMACTAASYGASYQATETSCDGRDNDCDGTTDEGCTCVDGTTQACGISTGACERGTQTCASGEWGACTGGVGPTAELCNGLDDDCNGVSDDGLTAPSCALSDGVCAGATQTCGGAMGWLACAGTASYGPRYVMTEDGSMDETQCDGLDNDCNGTIDDTCASGPLVSGTEDVVAPGLYHRNLAYSVLRGGNLEIVFHNLDRGAPRQLTATPEDESSVRISGDRLVFLRGTGSATRAVLYDLTTDTETVLSSAETTKVDIAGTFVVWDQLVGGTHFDVFVRDLSSGITTNLGAPGTDEASPDIRGGRILYIANDSGQWLVNMIAYDDTAGAWGAPVTQTPGTTSGAGHITPRLDFVVGAWSDGRSIASSTPGLTDDWDAYYAPFDPTTGFNAFPGENVLANGSGAEIIRNVDSQIFVYDDYNTGDWNVSVAAFGSPGGAITSSTATQRFATNSGSHVVWHDNRLGSFDIYQSFLPGATYRPSAGSVVIAEVLADPASGADPNGDGTASTTNDEFVELVNLTAVPIDIGGLTLSDATGVRHTFPAGTWVPSLGVVVVFAGGTPTGTFGGAAVQVASSGALGLNNTGDTLTLRDGATVIDMASYGSEGGMDQSIVRDGATWVRHSTLPGSVGAYSVGTFPDGYLP